MKYVVRERTHTFFLKIWKRNEPKCKFVWERHGEFESFSEKEEDEQSEMFEGKTEKV